MNWLFKWCAKYAFLPKTTDSKCFPNSCVKSISTIFELYTTSFEKKILWIAESCDALVPMFIKLFSFFFLTNSRTLFSGMKRSMMNLMAPNVAQKVSMWHRVHQCIIHVHWLASRSSNINYTRFWPKIKNFPHDSNLVEFIIWMLLTLLRQNKRVFYNFQRDQQTSNEENKQCIGNINYKIRFEYPNDKTKSTMINSFKFLVLIQ